MYTQEEMQLITDYLDLVEWLIDEERLMEIPSMKHFLEAKAFFNSGGFDPDKLH